MTEPYGYDEDPENDQDDDSNEQTVRLTRAQIRTMERDAKSARKATEELAAVRRELALARSGLSDLTERQQKALLATIDGDLTAESARAAAEELGFVQPQAASPAADEQQAMERMSEASSGAGPTGNNDEESKVARLRAAAEQGPEAFYAQLQADGAAVTPAR